MTKVESYITTALMFLDTEEKVDNLIRYFQSIPDDELPPPFILVYMNALTKVKSGIFSNKYEGKYEEAFRLLDETELLWEDRMVLKIEEVSEDIVEPLNHIMVNTYLSPETRYLFLKSLKTVKVSLDLNTAKSLFFVLLINETLPKPLEGKFLELMETFKDALPDLDLLTYRNLVLMLVLFKMYIEPTHT